MSATASSSDAFGPEPEDVVIGHTPAGEEIHRITDGDGSYVGTVTEVDGLIVPHGHGTKTFTSGDAYEGNFCEGVFQGEGSYRWVDGFTYVGAFLDDAQHGYGVFTEPGGNVYKGQWVQDVREGEGTTVFASGGRYIGHYKNDVSWGEGERVYADGSVYTGGWVNDVRSGRGVMRFATGDVYDGEWADDAMNGFGTYTWASDGRMRVGTFANGRSHGDGREYHADGVVYIGRWENGESLGLAVDQHAPPAPLGTAAAAASKTASSPSSPHAKGQQQQQQGHGGQSSDLIAAMRAAMAAADLAAPVKTPLPPSFFQSGGGATNAASASPQQPQPQPAGAGDSAIPASEIERVLGNLPQSIRDSVCVTASILPKSGASPSPSPASAVHSPLSHQQHPLAAGSLASFASEHHGITVNDLERFTPMSLLGRGSFGSAYEAVLPNGRVVCVKVIQLSSIREEAALAALMNEISLMRRLQHPNVVDFYGCTRQEDKHALNIFMEYVTGGCLVTYAKKFKVIPEQTIRRWSCQMLRACRYLHANNIVHRDIKGDNILVTNDGIIKFADFGCSKGLDVADSGMSGCNTMVGTPYWMAPEVIMCSSDSNSSYGTKADVWSVGCTIIEMVTGAAPWPECSSVWRAVYQIANATGPPPLDNPRISDELREFLKALFIRDPARRPSAEELLRHPYLASVAGHSGR